MKRAFLFLLIASVRLSADEPAKHPDPTLEARFVDGSRLRMAVVDDVVPIQTLYGRLLIPRADIRGIDFGPRLPEKVLQQMDAAITDLASADLSTRDAAMARLLKMGPSAFPAVARACQSDNRSLTISAKQLREKFMEKFPNEHLSEHDLDVIHTDDAKFAGHLEVQNVHVWTTQFGERTLNIVDLVGMRTIPASKADDALVVKADPGNLAEYAEQVGKTFRFTVTGNTTGTIYGTDVYTTDSVLATAVVHAGILKAGETGVVAVTIIEGLARYRSMTRNGVTSTSWNAFPTAFKVSKAPKQ
jgi:LCCL domain-containing protein